MVCCSVWVLFSLYLGAESWSPPPFSATTIAPQVPTTQKGIEKLQEDVEIEARKRHNNNIFNALFVSAPERPNPVPFALENIHKIPSDFPCGAYVRMGPNGATQDEGFLDGDGMLHTITFPPNDAPCLYSSTYVDTVGRQKEREVGCRLKGTLGAAPNGLGMLGALAQNMWMVKSTQGQKDTCNTAISVHGGRALALMEQGLPAELSFCRDGSVKTLQAGTYLDGALPKNDALTGGQLSAHGKTCSFTGDRIHVSYCSSNKPYARVDIFSTNQQGQGWQAKKSIDVDLEVPTMIHDCAITRDYAIVLDFPLTLRPLRMLADKFPVEYEPTHGARIGLVSRESGKTQWFPVDPCVVLHTMNAYETEDGRVVLQAARSVPKSEETYIASYTPAFLHEWVLDPATGTTTESCINADTMIEFPALDERWTGKPAKTGYAVSVRSIGGPLQVHTVPKVGITLDGVVKFALADTDDQMKGAVLEKYTFDDDWYGVSESTVIPKEGKEGHYVAVVATQVPRDIPAFPENSGVELKSKFILLDGENLSNGPVWEAGLPYSIPYGLHSGFVDWKDMN